MVLVRRELCTKLCIQADLADGVSLAAAFGLALTDADLIHRRS